MAKKKAEHESGHPKHEGGKMHLHEVRTVQNHDGSLTHHHHYKKHPDDQHISLVRDHAASSVTPEDAGQHVTDQFSMNQMGGGQPQGEPDGDEGGQGEAPEE